MEDIIPSIGDLVRDLVVGGLSWATVFAWKKYISRINVSRMPAWTIHVLIVYTVITLCIFSYNYYQLHKPHIQHHNEVYNFQTIVLDGNDYSDCVFNNCLLLIEGKKSFGLVRPLINNSHLELTKRASIGINLLAIMKEDKAMEPHVINYFERLKSDKVNYNLPGITLEDL